MSHQSINQRYLSDEGDAFAREELLPVVRRYRKTSAPLPPPYTSTSLTILEVGCGYGRNLVALSDLPHAHIVGCDTSLEELNKACERLSRNHIITTKDVNESLGRRGCSLSQRGLSEAAQAAEFRSKTSAPPPALGIRPEKNFVPPSPLATTVQLIHQKNGFKLPFDDSNFDMVVLWQVLEHILDRSTKRQILYECTRVLKPHGHLIIETPNFWFPFDYHDNGLPFIHWLLPDSLRYRLTRLRRTENFPPSQYTSILELRRMLDSSPHAGAIRQRTQIYFEERYRDIFAHLGGTNIPLKRLFFILYFPLYLLLRALGLPGDLFTPSIRVVFQIEKVNW